MGKDRDSGKAQDHHRRPKQDKQKAKEHYAKEANKATGESNGKGKK